MLALSAYENYCANRISTWPVDGSGRNSAIPWKSGDFRLWIAGARELDLSDKDVGVILIGHGAAWEERSQLISHFRRTLPGISVIASLRQSDKPFANADFNCPADNPPEWVRSVRQALAGLN